MSARTCPNAGVYRNAPRSEVFPPDAQYRLLRSIAQYAYASNPNIDRAWLARITYGSDTTPTIVSACRIARRWAGRSLPIAAGINRWARLRLRAVIVSRYPHRGSSRRCALPRACFRRRPTGEATRQGPQLTSLLKRPDSVPLDKPLQWPASARPRRARTAGAR